MENKILFGIMTIIFNAVGVPDFMQGNVGKGIGKIALSLFTCSVGAIILEIKGIIQGIKILKMSDEEYKNTFLTK
ncbi:MAG: hypothetical protein J6B86_00075 [Clostridia bacterium]|nr:hypothetical protein [Clostridia bacterium]